MGISDALDGTEDDLLGMSSDEEDNFDGFPDEAVEEAEQYAANVASAIDNTTLSEKSDPQESSAELDSDSDDDDCCPSSPGH